MNIIDKFLNNEELSEDEVRMIVYGSEDFCNDLRLLTVEAEILEINRWDLTCSFLIKIQDNDKIKAYKVYYRKMATEYQKYGFWKQVAEEAFPVQITKYLTKEEAKCYEEIENKKEEYNE